MLKIDGIMLFLVLKILHTHVVRGDKGRPEPIKAKVSSFFPYE